MHVELDEVRAKGESVPEGEQAVFRPEERAAPVCGEERRGRRLRPARHAHGGKDAECPDHD
jgi:hypothetical protein